MYMYVPRELYFLRFTHSWSTPRNLRTGRLGAHRAKGFIYKQNSNKYFLTTKKKKGFIHPLKWTSVLSATILPLFTLPPITDLAYFPWEVTTSLPLGPCRALDGTEFAPPSFPAEWAQGLGLGHRWIRNHSLSTSSMAVQSFSRSLRCARKGERGRTEIWCCWEPSCQYLNWGCRTHGESRAERRRETKPPRTEAPFLSLTPGHESSMSPLPQPIYFQLKPAWL